MSYRDLYDFCQALSPPISRRTIIDKAVELTGLPRPKVQAVGFDVEKVRGVIYFPGAFPNQTLATQAGSSPLIQIARDLNECWRRFVVAKEVMHYFDTNLERVSSTQEFEDLVEQFAAQEGNPSAAFLSEVKAFWMALALFCPENLRQDYERQLEAGTLSDAQIAQFLRIPLNYVPHLFRPNFKSIVQRLL